MRGLIGAIIRHGIDEDGWSLGRKFDARQSAEQAAQQFLNIYGELLSCFQLTGDFGLWQTMQTYIQSKGLLPECLECVTDGDELGYRQAIFATQERAFVDLYENRNALARLQLVESLPAEAQAQLSRMKRSVGTTLASEASTPAEPSEPPTPATVVLTPLEQVVLDFRGDKAKGIPPMASDLFRKTWINDRRRRPVYDQAVAEGLV